MAPMFRVLRLALWLCAAVTLLAGPANAAGKKPPCPDDGRHRAACTKEIRVWNNTSTTIYVVLQGTNQNTNALNCPRDPKGGGDVWLQAAFGDSSKCYKVNHDYYVYINPKTGIAPKSFASVNLPWWSKRASGADDVYIDWWRGGRVFIFDDQEALNDSYANLKRGDPVVMAPNSPTVTCKTSKGNKCIPGELQIFQVTAKAAIAAHTPFQLNEFTFADVSPLKDNGQSGGEFVDFNQGYNVSNVDQVYLPIAIEPVRKPADVGYMGSIMSVEDFRKQLAAFTGADVNPTNPAKWPIYNNPIVNNKPLYPKAGIRVPSTLAVFNYYMNPSSFGGGKPEIIPAKPPQLVSDVIDQWKVCTAASLRRRPKGDACPQDKIYQEIDKAFQDSYAFYIANCTPPDYLKPVNGKPPLFAYLRFIHGWVPFNTACTVKVPDLPTADQPPAGSRAPIDYINVQYNYEIRRLDPKQWFNPYTQLIHGAVAAGGLAANAYAFSIDDHSSFQSNSGGSLPGGLIIAVGGKNGLPNKTQVPPPIPPFYKYFDFVVALGAPTVGTTASWAKYGICKDEADTLFPGPASLGYNLGVDPAQANISPSKPCTIALTDTKNRKYQIQILKAQEPPAAIWPPFQPNGTSHFDPTVVSCPAAQGVVPPDQWCKGTNELAIPASPPNAPTYSLSTAPPLPLQ